MNKIRGVRVRDKDLAVLVVNENHEKFKQLGKIIGHKGIIHRTTIVKFPDGEAYEFPRDSEGDYLIQFYRHDDQTGNRLDLGENGDRRGPSALARQYLELNTTNGFTLFIDGYRQLFNQDPERRY